MAETSNGTESGALCSKCGKNPRAKSHDWCLECKAELQQRYNGDRNRMLKSQGYIQGVNDMREILAAEFARLGTAFFRGDECAALIMRAKGPVPTEELIAQIP